MSEENIAHKGRPEDGVSPPWISKDLKKNNPTRTHYGVKVNDDEQTDFHDNVPLEATIQGRVALFTPYSEIGQMQEAMEQLLSSERFSLNVESIQNPRIGDLTQEIPHYDAYVIDASRNDLTHEQTERLATFSREVKSKHPYCGILLLGNREVYRKDVYTPLKHAYSQQGTIDAIVEGTSSTSPLGAEEHSVRRH